MWDAAAGPRGMRLLRHADGVGRRLAALGRAGFAGRLARGDASLFGDSPTVRRIAARRLGWLKAPARFLEEAPALREFARQVREDGIRHVVLLGMGDRACVRSCSGIFSHRPRASPI